MPLDSPSTAPLTLRPRWTWYQGQFVEGLRLTIQDGRIVRLSDQPEPREIDLGDRLLLPGLVNAHTHLEFSRLARPIPHAGTFASWIRAVVQWRRGQTDTDYQAALRVGLAESTAAGIAVLGEISTRSQESEPGGDDPHQVIFREALGLTQAAVASLLE